MESYQFDIIVSKLDAIISLIKEKKDKDGATKPI